MLGSVGAPQFPHPWHFCFAKTVTISQGLAGSDTHLLEQPGLSLRVPLCPLCVGGGPAHTPLCGHSCLLPMEMQGPAPSSYPPFCYFSSGPFRV